MKWRFGYILVLWQTFEAANPLLYSIKTRKRIIWGLELYLLAGLIKFYKALEEPQKEAKEAIGGICTLCMEARPHRAHHCRQCSKCIPNFDHHCGIIGICITLAHIPALHGFLAIFSLEAIVGFVYGLLNLQIQIDLPVIMSLPILLFIIAVLVPNAIRTFIKFSSGLSEIELRRFRSAMLSFDSHAVQRIRIKSHQDNCILRLISPFLFLIVPLNPKLTFKAPSKIEAEIIKYIFT